MIVHVHTQTPYDVQIGAGLTDRLADLLPADILQKGRRGAKAVLLTDEHVQALYGERISQNLIALGFTVLPVTVPAGETAKSGAQYLTVLSQLADAHVSRTDVLFALGGGVPGDLGGFVAATYQRGIDFVQLPTTLLAAVDSSVGGKTAINLPEGKNLVGAFYQPRAVIMDVETLDTLPAEIFADGCAEVIKYGMIRDEALFEMLASRPLPACRDDRAYVSRIIWRCVTIKEEVVSGDERDRGLRNILNFGHTVGHAIEKCSGFTVAHGRAVAVGMVMACRCAARAGFCEESVADRLQDVLRAYGLPTETRIPASSLASCLLSDKKIDGGSINLILPRRIGACEIVPHPVADLAAFLFGAEDAGGVGGATV